MRSLTCDIELAWAAGFFDGEGNVRNRTAISKKLANGTTAIYTGLLHLQISQNEREPLERFQKAVGGAGGIYWHKNGHWKYSVAKYDEVYEIVEKLFPLLCSVKQAQIDAVLSMGKGRMVK
jgi:hypothetical protein